MSTSEKVSANYSAAMVARIEESAPLDLAKAKALGTELGRTYRSVIAKANSLGIEYIKKPSPVKAKSEPTKAELVSGVEAAMDVADDTLAGITKGTVTAITALLERAIEMAEEIEEYRDLLGFDADDSDDESQG